MADGPSPFKQRLRLVWLLVLCAGCLLLTGVTAFSFWRFDHFRLDIVAQFRPQYAFGCCALLLLALFSKCRRIAWITGISCILNLWQILSIPNVQPPLPDKPSYRVLSLNLYLENKQSAQVLDLINRSQPDILLLIETQLLLPQLAASLRKIYPYQLLSWSYTPNGMVLYSKYPLKKAPDAPPSVSAAEVALGGDSLWLVGCHPPSPRTQNFYEKRNQYYQELAKFVRKQSGSMLVFGDFNSAPWAPTFRHFLANSKLTMVNSRYWRQPTWPSNKFWMGVPIDHFLYTGGVRALEQYRSDSAGSDHYSIQMAFQLE